MNVLKKLLFQNPTPIKTNHTDEEKLTTRQQQQQQQQQEVGLGFQPSSSVDHDPRLDRIVPPSGDPDQQTTNEEIANQEHQVLQLISEAIQKQLLLEENEEVSDKYVDREGDVDDEVSNQKTLNEELRHQQAFENEIQNIVLEENRNENNDYDKGEKDIGYGNNGDDDGDNYDTSEIEKQDDANAFVEGESGLMAGRKDERYTRSPYPVKPDAQDCQFYMRTGACKFGLNCMFNHPSRRKNQAAKEKVKEKVKQKEESPERPGQVECKYYLSSGGCKHGKACRYKHSIRKTPVAPLVEGIRKTPVAPVVEFNFLGLPIRLGEKECPYYMRHGSCKYGSNCRFNHPDPTAMGGGDTLSGYGNGGSVPLQGASQSTMSPWSPPRALSETGPFVPVVFSPTQGVPSPYPERNGYQWPSKDHGYPAPSERRLPTPPAFSLNTPAEINYYTPHNHLILTDEFPERPGQPECSYFRKTGSCKYKSGCKFHHPKNRLLKTAAPFAPPLSDNGLPQRPDQNICSHYSRYGICKFGPACKFDHPVNYGHSASSPPEFDAPANSSSFGNSATVDDGWE